MSDVLPISCVVPQGSILGPLLFLIYVNDLALVSKHAKTILFADDTNAIYQSQTYEELIEVIGSDLPKITNWFKANRLALNESKTNYVIFHTRFNRPPNNFCIKMNGIELERVHHTKFLGVLIQENLKWNTHINYISKRVSRSIGILAILKHYLFQTFLMKVFFTKVLIFDRCV